MTQVTWFGVLFVAILSSGCETNRHMVLAATGTSIGVEVSQNPATQSPQAKLGYQRTEVAIVPTNRSTKDDPFPSNPAGGSVPQSGGGAKDLGDVIMEIRYGGIFDLGASSGIYQRLAVGAEAVRQPGASLMFAKDADGKMSPDAATALKALKGVPESSPTVLKAQACLTEQRKDSAKGTTIDAAVKKVHNMTWNDFVLSNPTDEKMKALLDELKPQGIECK